MTVPPTPDQPHPTGAPAPFGPDLPPGRPAKKSKNKRWLLLAVAVLGLALISGGCVALRALNAAAPGPGDCIVFRPPHKTDIDQRLRPVKADCGSSDTEFKLISSSGTNHSCAPGHRMYQWRKVKNGQLGEPTQTWCLQPLPGGVTQAPAP